jgi:hypothetical protein
VPLDAADWDRLPGQIGFAPRQRAVFVAIVLNEVALDTRALELASSRNAIHKMLFGAHISCGQLSPLRE